MDRRDFFNAAAVFLSAAGLADGASGKLHNTVINGSQVQAKQEPFGELRVFYEGPTDQLKSMTAGSLRLKPGMEPHPPHQHDEEEMMVITEGSGEMVVDGKTSKVGPGSMMYCAGNHLHGIKNTGSTPLLFYYYKWLK